jgi:hypothetical protein
MKIKAGGPLQPGNKLGEKAVGTKVNSVKSALTKPTWVRNAGSFVNWMRNLQKEGLSLGKTELDEIVKMARDLQVKVRLDPPHKAPYDYPHLNIGKTGQAHVRVPEGYILPD